MVLMVKCIFCNIIAGTEPAQFCYYLGNDVWCFKPLNPVTKGHTLFVHEMHTSNAGDKPYIAGIVFDKASAWAEYRYNDYNLITSINIWLIISIKVLSSNINSSSNGI